MKLLEALKRNVPDKIFSRGEKYYHDGRILDYSVKKIEEGQFEIEAKVRGSSVYVIDLFLKVQGTHFNLFGDCSCPYDWGSVCKHEIAVLYRFLTEDFEQYNAQNRNREYKRLQELSQSVMPVERISLNYTLRGLMTTSMINFKLILHSTELTEAELKVLTSYIHESAFYRPPRVKDKISYSDLNNIEYLARTETTKSKTPGAILFPKNTANFNFLLNLMDKAEVVLDETGEMVKSGQQYFPELEMVGDENRITVRPVETENTIYEHINAEERFACTIIEGRVYPVNFDVFRGLPGKIDIPEERKGEFLFEIIPSLKKNLNLQLPAGLEDYRLIKREPRIQLEFDYQEDAIFCYSQVEIDNNTYENAEILEIDPEAKYYQRDEEDSRVWYCRDTEALQNFISFLEYNEFHVHPEGFIIRDEIEIQDFITDGFLHLAEEWEVKTTSAFDQVEIVPIELEPVVELDDDGDKINWFEFTITFNLGGRSYSYQELKEMLRYNKHGDGYIRIGQQYFIIQEEEKEKQVQKALELAEEIDDGKYRSNYYNLLYYRNLLAESGISFKGNQVLNELEEDISGKQLVDEVEVPAEVSDILRNYQRQGYYWFRFLDKYKFGGILADDMGLGKTLQALTFLKSVSRKEPALIVCPRTLIYNWGEEIEKFFPNIKYLVYYGNPTEREEMRKELKEYELIISSYSIISRDYQELKDNSFSYCILDEAQHIKNHRTKRAKGVKQIRANGHLALTGTPIENSVEELWSIMDFLMTGYLGNYNQFRKKYIQPIKNEDFSRLVELKKRVAPFILRRKKEDVLRELPDKLVNIYPVKMTRLQEDSYRVVLDEMKANLMKTVTERGFNQSRINVLTVLTKLRQICNHPALVLEAEQKQTSGKLEALMELIQDAVDGGHKLIVFSQFVKMLRLIRDRLQTIGLEFEYLDGSTRNRMERVKNFNTQDNIKVFLISLKAGGYGLNLTAADMVIHVDPWWNPMVERQATDRAHRIGQDKKVMVYKLITRGTVEEKMLKLQEKKRDIFNNVIEDNVNPLNNITWEDIQELLEYDN